MKANISIIVPAYNCAKTIKKCIFSLLNQSYPYFKVIIIDDGSTDNTLSILYEFNDSRIKIIHQSNKGVSAARNKGLSFVITKYVAFVDADDYVGKDYLQKLIDGYSSDDIGLSIGGYKEVDNSKNITEISFKEKICLTDELLVNILTSNGVMGFLWNKLWRMDIISKFSLLFDSKISMAEDLLFAIEYIKHVCYAHIIKNCNYYHVYCESSLSAQTGITRLGSRYKESFNSFLTAEKEILRIIPRENTLAKNTARAKLAVTYANFLRAIELDNNTLKNKLLINKIRKICISYTKVVISKDNLLSFKEKIIFILTTYLAPIMRIIDRYRINTMSEEE